MADDKTLGIDLGTTNSGIAIVEAGDPQMVANNDGNRLTDSVVHYDEDGKALVGRRAIERESAEPDQVIREIKRHMGEDGYTETVLGQEYTPTEVSAEILRKLKDDTEAYLGTEPTEAVVTVPAYFTIDQTAATKEAAEKAGFDETHLINEPTAAALAYGNGKDLDETILVYDFGGGTLDISVIEVADDHYDVLAVDGDNELGGTDFDRAVMELLADRYEQEKGIDILEDDEVEAKLRVQAENLKKNLSSDHEAEALAAFLGQIEGEIIDITEINNTVTRETFEEETADLRDRAIDPVSDALEKADLDTDDIDTVLLVGGSTLIPSIQDRLQEFVGIEPTHTLDPDKIVAQGAAVYAQREIEFGYRCGICGMDFDAWLTLTEHYDEEHGGDTDGFECLYCDEVLNSESERDTHVRSEHPEEIAPDKPGITDIVSHSLGTKLKDGSMDVIIEDGENNEDAVGVGEYTTTADEQTQVTVGVYQGEHERAEENVKIGQLQLTGIPPKPAGEPLIEVTYDYDDDGIVHVEAVEKDSGKTVDGEFEL